MRAPRWIRLALWYVSEAAKLAALLAALIVAGALALAFTIPAPL